MNRGSLIILLCVFLGSACTSSPEAAVPTVSLSSTPDLQLSPLPSRTPAAAEPVLRAGQWTYLFYRDEPGQVVLVNGGPEQGKPMDEPLELWSWDGERWSLLQADERGPTWRNWAAAAYDPVRDVLVIHGGLQSRTHFAETWEWDGRTWTKLSGSGPGAREGALMAYDAGRASMILFGGATPDLELHGDTWEWDGQTWTRLSDDGPAPRFPGGLVYDPAREQLLLRGGHFAEPAGGAIDYDDLWAWEEGLWREIPMDGPTPGPRAHAGFVFDPLTEKVLLIGSGGDTFLGDIWAWDGAAWEKLPGAEAPVRSGHSVVYDPARDRFVLFGGVARPGARALDDTWEWDRAQWICVSNCT